MAEPIKYTPTILKYDGDVVKEREKFIGGSEAGTILGLNPWKSPYTLWLEKTGKVEVEDISDKEAVWWGKEEEELVAKRFGQKTGKKPRNSNATYALEEYPFIRGHIDRKIVGENAILECKTTSAWSTTDYRGGEIPPMYYAQCMHYLMVTGEEVCYIAVKQDNCHFYWFEVKRNEEEIQALLDAEIKFMELVNTNTPPSVDGSVSTTSSLNEMYDGEDDTPVTLEEATNYKAAKIQDIDAQIKALEEEKKQAQNEIKQLMAEHTEAFTTRYKFTWKNVSRDTLDTKKLKEEQPDIYEQYLKTSTTRTFKFKEFKE